MKNLQYGSPGGMSILEQFSILFRNGLSVGPSTDHNVYRYPKLRNEKADRYLYRTKIVKG